MPIIIPERLIVALQKKQYTEVEGALKANEELINCTDQQGTSLLQMIIYATDPGDTVTPLLKFMLNHKKFDWAYASKGYGTNVAFILDAHRIDILRLMYANPELHAHVRYVLVNKGMDLSYEFARNKLNESIVDLEDTRAEGAKPKAIAIREREVKGHQAAVAFLRDVTILHAIKKDNVGLMDYLEKIGANPREKLGELGQNALPISLLKPTNKALSAWFETKGSSAQNANLVPTPVAPPVKTAPALAPGSADNMSIMGLFGQLEALQKQKAKATIDYTQACMNVHLNTVQANLAQINSVITHETARIAQVK